MKRNSFLAILLVAGFAACKKESAKVPITTYSFSRRALEYVQLTEGKYLVYKDSATSVLDSVVVTNSKLENVYVPAVESQNILNYESAYYREDLKLTLAKYNGTSGTEWLQAHAQSVINAGYYYIHENLPLSLITSNGDPVFLFYDTDNSNLSMTIEGRTFNEVVVHEYNNLADINDPAYRKTIFYWAKHIGIIKRTVITTGGNIKTWTLLRNN